MDDAGVHHCHDFRTNVSAPLTDQHIARARLCVHVHGPRLSQRIFTEQINDAPCPPLDSRLNRIQARLYRILSRHKFLMTQRVVGGSRAVTLTDGALHDGHHQDRQLRRLTLRQPKHKGNLTRLWCSANTSVEKQSSLK